MTNDPSMLADLSHAAMDAAFADGTAWYMSETIRDFTRYRESWWMYDRVRLVGSDQGGRRGQARPDGRDHAPR